MAENDPPNRPAIIPPTKCDSNPTPPPEYLRPGHPTYYASLGRHCANEICPGFIWTDEHRRVMNILISYFFGLKNGICQLYGIDPNKSIALCGTYGVGKTIMFRIVHRMIELRYQLPSERVVSFRETSIESIVNAMRNDDFMDGELFHRIETVDGVRIKKPLNIVINEFGVEYTGKHFGTPITELIDTFLMKRYEIYQTDRRFTHATMNYSIDELKSKFSARLIDRFREMMNFIPVYGESMRDIKKPTP